MGELLAVVITDTEKDKITGDIPIFIASDQAEKEKISRFLSRSLDAMVHDLDNGVYYIVRH